jgi:hypothetical protein
LKLKVKIIIITSDFKIAGIKVVIPHDNAGGGKSVKQENTARGFGALFEFSGIRTMVGFLQL